MTQDFSIFLDLRPTLVRVAYTFFRNWEDAEDVVQETLIKVWNRRDRWEELDSIEAFCLSICRNISLDKMKKAENQNPSLESLRVGEWNSGTDGHDAPDHSYSSNPEEQAMQRDRIALVRQLIDNLPEKQRSCMQLREFEGKSYKEIAQILGVTEEQVKINIFRARQQIKQQFIKTENYGL